jgi:hypothetical protein
MREENLTLRQQSNELTRLRETNARLAKLKVDADELERLRLEHTELMRLRGEVGMLRRNLRERESIATAPSIAPKHAPVWESFDLSQFSDSGSRIRSTAAADVGNATPAALLQTWVWAQETGNIEGLIKVCDFPSETEKERFLREWAAHKKSSDQHAEQVGRADYYRLSTLLPLGDEKYLALIAEYFPGMGANVMRQVFVRREGQWKVSTVPPTYEPPGR